MNLAHKVREILLKEYGHLYSYYSAPHDPPGTCFYCGSWADTADHSPPISFADVLVNMDNRPDFYLVPACRRCNAILGNKTLFTLRERSGHIRDRLIEKYDRESALWSEEEILQMSPMFQKTIRARKEKLYLQVDAIRFAEKRAIDFVSYPD